MTGVPGSGKTVLLYALAEAAQATHDLAVLRVGRPAVQQGRDTR